MNNSRRKAERKLALDATKNHFNDVFNIQLETLRVFADEYLKAISNELSESFNATYNLHAYMEGDVYIFEHGIFLSVPGRQAFFDLFTRKAQIYELVPDYWAKEKIFIIQNRALIYETASGARISNADILEFREHLKSIKLT